MYAEVRVTRVVRHDSTGSLTVALARPLNSLHDPIGRMVNLGDLEDNTQATRLLDIDEADASSDGM